MSYSTLGAADSRGGYRGRRTPKLAVVSTQQTPPIISRPINTLSRPIKTHQSPPPIFQPIKSYPNPYQSPPIMQQKCACPVNGLGSLNPQINQLAKFLENYKSYVLAFSPATNSIAAYQQGMGKVAFSIKLSKNEPTDAGLSKARAMIDAQSSDGMGNMFNDKAQRKISSVRGGPVRSGQQFDFNPNTAWGSRYAPAPSHASRSGNGLRRSIPFYAAGMMGVDGVTPIVLDPPIEQQELRWDTPSLTLYMGSNKIAIIPALLSALAVKLLMFSGSSVTSGAKSFWGGADKAAKRVARA